MRRLVRSLPALALGAWAAVLSALGAWAMRPHWNPLPHPDPDGQVWNGAAGAGDGRWTALHVLKDGCRCSARVLGHLAARGPEPGVRERVLWVGDGSGPGSPPPGYEVEPLSPAALAARYDLRAAPMLVVLGPDGSLRYGGGYTARKQGPDLRDRTILARVRAGERVPPLPVLGCPIEFATDNP